MENFEIEGVWWLPENPSVKLPGILRFSHEYGLVLEVLGLFKRLEKMTHFLAPDIILGLSIRGKNITLYNCIEKAAKINLLGISKSTFIADYGFIGVSFERISDIKFKKVSIKYNHLGKWLNRSGFNRISIKGDSAKVEYELPEPIVVVLNDKLKVKLEIRANMSQKLEPKEVRIKEEIYFTLEFSEEEAFDEIYKYINMFQNLFTLLISEVVYPIQIIGNSEKAVRIFEESKHYEPINIVYQLPISMIGSTNKAIYANEVFCPYEVIKDKIGGIFNNWLEKMELLKPVSDLYFGVVYSKNIFSEFKFLSLVLSLEAYHRRVIGNEDISNFEHEKRIREILNSVPNEYREWLKEKLKYSNEPSLRKRLKQIFNLLKNIRYIDELVPDKKRFVDRVVNTRNYYVHYDKALKDKIIDAEQFYWYIQILKTIVLACLLRETGFTDEEIDKLFMQSKEFTWLLNQVKKI